MHITHDQVNKCRLLKTHLFAFRAVFGFCSNVPSANDVLLTLQLSFCFTDPVSDAACSWRARTTFRDEKRMRLIGVRLGRGRRPFFVTHFFGTMKEFSEAQKRIPLHFPKVERK